MQRTLRLLLCVHINKPTTNEIFPMKKNPLLRLIVIVAILSITACASSKPVQLWQDPGFKKPVEKILVIAAIQRSTQRRVYEDLFEKPISNLDVEVVPSYTIATTEVSISPKSLKSAISRENLEGILVTRLMGFDEEQEYQPPNEQEHYQDYNAYYKYALKRSDSKLLRGFNSLMLETCLFDAKSGQLIWFMQSETIERSIPRHMLQDQITLTVLKMAESGVIPNTP